MSSMLKKKGGFAFKPKAPQVRRTPVATPSSSGTPAPRPSSTARDVATSQQSPSPQVAAPVSKEAVAAPTAEAGPVAENTAAVTTQDTRTQPAKSTSSTISPSKRITTSSEPATAKQGGGVDKITAGVSKSVERPTIPPTAVPGQDAVEAAALRLATPGIQSPSSSSGKDRAPKAGALLRAATTGAKRKSPSGTESEAQSASDTRPAPVREGDEGAGQELENSPPRKRQRRATRAGTAETTASTTATGSEQQGDDTSVEISTPTVTNGAAAPAPEPSTQSGRRYKRASAASRKQPEVNSNEPRAAGDANVGAEASQPGNVDNPIRKKRQTRRKPAASKGNVNQPPDAEAGSSRAVQPRKRGPRKKKAPAAPVESDAEPEENDEELSRRARTSTPEDAEMQTVDTAELTMAELTKDLHIGKKFSRHDELRNREREKRSKAIRARKLKAMGIREGPDGDRGEAEPGAENGNAAMANTAPSRNEPVPIPAAAIAGPQFDVINGVMVVNRASLLHDRHAHAAAENGPLEEVEEDDFTHHTTSTTYRKPGKLRGSNPWSEEDTIEFYNALEMWGTNFTIIATLFPGRTPRQIKLKFNREDKLNPDRITEAMIPKAKKSAIDLDEYQQRTGIQLETTESIQAAHQARQEKHDEEQRRVKEAEAEELRKKRDELLSGPGGGKGADAATERHNGPGGKKDRPGLDKDGRPHVARGTAPGQAEVEEIDETEDHATAKAGRGRGGRGRGGRGRSARIGASGFGV